MVKDIDESKAPLLEHLIELRTRLIHSIVAILVLFMVGFYFAQDVYNFLVEPLFQIYQSLGQTDRMMVYTALHEAFFTQVKVALFSALFVSFPFVAAQIWMFVAPGLYKHEKGAFLPFLVLTPILFFTGGAFVYYVMFPVAWEFFLSFEQVGGDETMAIQSLPKVSEYLSLVMKLIFAFGISFELPLLLTLLARVGLTSAAGLAEKRKYAVVMAFVAAAILTPPDPISQISLAVPIIVLYEVSILAVRVIEKRRAAREAARNKGGADGGDDDAV